MKRAILFVLSGFAFATIYSQNIVKEHYTVSGGLLGAANFSEFRITGDNPNDIDYDTKTGWSAGAWFNFPVSKAFSLEPQIMYSSYRYRTTSTAPLLLNDGKISYISVPLLLKFHIGDNFAITAGPQVDFLSSIDDENNATKEEDFNKTSLSAFGGLELFPHGRVTVFGRY
ncbi:MAG TPA: porin family protein, partial [Chitinophagaceae bacterium]|nr:porin family protein [Chitinophagaceae bacterium]